MKPKLTDRAIRYAIRQLKKGRGTRVVAEELGVTQRHVQRLWAEYLKTGKAHVQRLAGRPAGPEPSEEIQAVLDVHGRKPEGVVRTAKRLRKEGCDISRYRTYGIMKSNGLVTASPAKSRQRKWVAGEFAIRSRLKPMPRQRPGFHGTLSGLLLPLLGVRPPHVRSSPPSRTPELVSSAMTLPIGLRAWTSIAAISPLAHPLVSGTLSFSGNAA